MAKRPKTIACLCAGFESALAEGFVDKINDEFYLASLASGGIGALHNLVYGPKISNCPFCGTALDDKAGLPPPE